MLSPFSCLRTLALIGLALAGIFSVSAATFAQGEAGLLDFKRDIQPILESKCLSCHGPEEAKNDFRIDDTDSVSGYLEPGDLESSSLWTDYLITDDEDMLMPPADDVQPGGLLGSELAVIKLWIEEGGQHAWVATEEAQPTSEKAEPVIDASLAKRIWAFQGLFHPASVHFPIALLMISGLFAVLSFFGRSSFEPVAFHCLWIGALGAVASCVMGWAYAAHEGYGQGFSYDIQNSAIDRHRWLGIAVAVIAVLLVPIAKSACESGSVNKRILWVLGALLIAVGASITGYQGGELTYGEDHYGKEFRRLFPEASSNVVVPAASTPDASDGQGDGSDPTAVPPTQDIQELSTKDVSEAPVD
ncbi:MAG: c-type cytochrome domain-containing protein [Pirellulaceae bacterium]